MRLATLLTLVLISGGLTFAQTGGSTSQSSSGSATRSTGLRPWALANGSYTKTLNSSANSRDYDSPGATIAVGLGGFKSWARKQVGGNITSSETYSRVGDAITSNGRRWRQSHVANLSYSQQLSQRVNFSISQLGGISDGGFGLASGSGANGVPGMSGSFGAGGSPFGPVFGDAAFRDPANNGFVDNEIFTSRVKFYGSNASIGYLINQRLQLSGGAGANFVRRGGQLYGMNTYGGGGNLRYMLNERSSVGGGGAVTSSSYPGLFGGVRTVSLFGTASHSFNPRTSIEGQAGLGRMTSNFIGAIPLPPDIAALLGSGSTLQVTQTEFNSPVFSATFHQMFEIGSMTLRGAHGFSTGNGFVQAGIQDTASVGFNRALGPKVSTGLMMAYYRVSGRVGVQQVTETAQGGLMLSYRIMGPISLTGQGGVRYRGLSGIYRQLEGYASVGFAWSPGDHAFGF